MCGNSAEKLFFKPWCEFAELLGVMQNRQYRGLRQPYWQAYGQSAKVAELIPSMLEAFMTSDNSIKKAHKSLAV